MNFTEQTKQIIDNAQSKLAHAFEYVDDIATYNQMKVLDAFRENIFYAKIAQ